MASEVEVEKRLMLEFHNEHFGTSYTTYDEVEAQLKRIVDEKKFPEMYKDDTDTAYDLARMIDDIDLIDSIGKDGIRCHIQNPASPVHDQILLLMLEWVQLRKKYLGIGGENND